MQVHFHSLKSSRGIATLIALIMVGMLTLIGLAIMETSNDEVSIAGNGLQETRAFYAAESGLEMAASLIEQEYDSTGVPPVTLPSGTDSVNMCAVTYTTADNGPATSEVLSGGDYAGLNALVKTFSVESEGISAVDNAKVGLSQNYEVALIPLFQFAVFYDHDLWASPLFDMTINGRVHVNGDMNIQAFKKLMFDGRVSASGKINHGLPNSQYSGANGDIFFKDRVGLYQNMLKSGKWLDASDPNWYTEAADRWDGQVRDQAFGQKTLNVPLNNSDADAHKIIERASGNPDSYEEKSTFKVIDGVPLSKIGGVWQNVSASLPAGTISNKSFYDSREKKTVNSTDVDISKLKGSTYFPSNGVIYSSDHRSGFNATRLTAGSSVGKPLSVYCENPVYVQGDFNSVDKQPVAVAADAVTFLSNSWNDANSTKSMNSRPASTTTANCAVISGDTKPTSSNYGGGLENLPRFLEDWDSKTFKYRGSLVSMWRSKQSTGAWRYGGSDEYYTAPTRDWGFDTDFSDPNKLPPATPSARVFFRSGWKQDYVGYAVE